MSRPWLPILVALVACRGDKLLPTGTPTPVTYFTATTTDTRFHTADHFLASIEMQISGEPFAQLLGRNLGGYDRASRIPDLYFDPTTFQVTVDPMSYSIAVESYEYSKQPMNNTSFESGAGLSLQYGPLLNPQNVTGDPAFVLLRDRLQHLALAANAGGPLMSNWVVSPAPTDNPLNVYGWPGFWPVFAEFASFDPAIAPTGGITRGCAFASGYGATMGANSKVGDYECGYNSLNLPDRDKQVEKVLDPAALGFAMWKQGLWTINYWQSLHDIDGNAILTVDAQDLASVGVPGNQVVGHYPNPNNPSVIIDGAPGTYFGDIPIEGWQGLVMLDEMDNKSALTLRALLTSDGATLGGFASTKEAIGYDYQAPLRWWPAAIAVTEAGAPPAAGTSWKYFPRPGALAVQAGASRLRGLSALMGGYAELFALTDAKNPQVGGQASALCLYDGDPFAADDGLPDGEESPHDRALANIKVAVIDMDRMHFDPARKVLVDEATVSAGAVVRGKSAGTVDAAYAIVALRQALRGISSSLVLYSNDTPDTIGAPTALDAAPLAGAPAPLPARMLQLIRAEADFLAGTLLDESGAAANGYDLAAGQRDPSPTKLESQAAAVRGLLEAYLATSDVKYRQAAERAWNDLDRRFWMKDVRAFRTTAGVDDTLTWTPLAFGTIQGAMRQYWKLVGRRPGNERLASEILERVQRTNKLVANGWDDANADNLVQYPGECTGAGLQMAERALTGELSHPEDKGDRDHDCVREISLAKLPSALAGEIVLKRR